MSNVTLVQACVLHVMLVIGVANVQTIVQTTVKTDAIYLQGNVSTVRLDMEESFVRVFVPRTV